MFLDRYRCPQEIADNAVDHIVYNGWIGVVQRVLNAERAQFIIDRNNLTSLAVAKQYVYEDPVSREVGVISVKSNFSFEGFRSRPISLEEMKQIVKFAKKSKFSDWYQG